MSGSTVNPAERINYASSRTPSNYVCGDCDVSGVKLWREYSRFLNDQVLRCASCAAKEENVAITDMNRKGMHFSEGLGLTDQIGNLFPAVPTVQNDMFWGYTAVPQDGCEWWNRLPNK